MNAILIFAPIVAAGVSVMNDLIDWQLTGGVSGPGPMPTHEQLP